MELKTIFFWILLLAFIIPTCYFGYTKLITEKTKTEAFKRWGYPLWFMRLLGLVEITAAIFLLFPSTRNIGIACSCCCIDRSRSNPY